MHNNHLTVNSGYWPHSHQDFDLINLESHYAFYLKGIESPDSNAANLIPNWNKVENFWKSTKNGLSIPFIFSYYVMLLKLQRHETIEILNLSIKTFILYIIGEKYEGLIGHSSTVKN